MKYPIFDPPDRDANLRRSFNWSNNRHVYVIKWTFGSSDKPMFLDEYPWGCKAIYKIGRSECPEDRLKVIRWSYRKKTMWPGSFEIIASKEESDKLSEKSLKEEYDLYNISHENGYEGGFIDSALTGRTEWFDLCWGIPDFTGSECIETRLLSKFFVEPQGRDKKGRFLEVESGSAIMLKMFARKQLKLDT
jgi:hypothetical protein